MRTLLAHEEDHAPLPGPPAILGAFLAVAMATGYTVTDKILAARGRTKMSKISADTTRGDR